MTQSGFHPCQSDCPECDVATLHLQGLWKQLGENPGTQDKTAAGQGTHRGWNSSIRARLSLPWPLPYRGHSANHMSSVFQARQLVQIFAKYFHQLRSINMVPFMNTCSSPQGNNACKHCDFQYHKPSKSEQTFPKLCSCWELEFQRLPLKNITTFLPYLSSSLS